MLVELYGVYVNPEKVYYIDYVKYGDGWAVVLGIAELPEFIYIPVKTEDIAIEIFITIKEMLSKYVKVIDENEELKKVEIETSDYYPSPDQKDLHEEFDRPPQKWYNFYRMDKYT